MQSFNLSNQLADQMFKNCWFELIEMKVMVACDWELVEQQWMMSQ